jgi:hypothetical protein
VAGKPGRSGGWNKLTPEEHRRRGTSYRSIPKASTLAVAVVPIREPLPEGVSAGLGAAGLTFAQDCWTSYQGWGPSSLRLLREAAVTIDALEGLRNQKGERQAQRMLLQVLAALRLEA